jgi:LAGLIDADG DNA endonuclease family protein
VPSLLFRLLSPRGSKFRPMNSIDSETQEVIVRVEAAPLEGLVAYLQGTLGDATWSTRHRTHRIGQSDVRWLQVIARALTRLGHRSWIYKEGRQRNFWILETSAAFLSRQFDARELLGRREALDYVRGYFDAEGGMPRKSEARAYFQFCQKNRQSLDAVQVLLSGNGISCGRLHIPSRMVDPNYWRFFVRAESHRDFMIRVGSWHPQKSVAVATRLLGGARTSDVKVGHRAQFASQQPKAK